MFKTTKVKAIEATLEETKKDNAIRIELIKKQTDYIAQLKEEKGTLLKEWEADRAGLLTRIGKLEARAQDLGFDLDVLLDDERWEKVKHLLFLSCGDMDVGTGGTFANKFQLGSAQAILDELISPKQDKLVPRRKALVAAK